VIEQRIPPAPQPTIDYIAGLLCMVTADQAGPLLVASMHRIIANGIERGWSSKLAGEYAADFGHRVVAALRQPRPMQ
jgi:hypothetical protein